MIKHIYFKLIFRQSEFDVFLHCTISSSQIFFVSVYSQGYKIRKLIIKSLAKDLSIVRLKFQLLKEQYILQMKICALQKIFMVTKQLG